MKKLLALFFVIYLAARLFFSLGSPYFSDDESYFALRQIDHIKETGKPLIHDNLSYGGRTFVLMPFYYYIMALFSFLNNVLALKIFQNLLASTIIISAYLLANRILKHKLIGMICAIMIACNPEYLEKTMNSLSPISIVVPGSLLLIYLFLDVNKNLNYIIFLTLLLSVTSGASIFLIISLIAYIILNYIYNKRLEKIEIEYISFYIMFFLWVIFILFKNAFQIHGFNIIYQNIPLRLEEHIDILSFLGSIGMASVALGIYALYDHLIKLKNENLTIISSILFCALILSWLEMISISYAIIFLAACFAILSGQMIKDFFLSLEKSKFLYLKRYALVFFTAVIIGQAVSGIGFAKTAAYEPTYLAAFKLMEIDLPKNTTILADPKDGNLITYFGNKKNIMDTQYLLAKDAEIRYNDIDAFYSSKFRINSLRILEKYDSEYFIVYNDTFPLEEDPCFSLVYLGELRLYQKKCEIDE